MEWNSCQSCPNVTWAKICSRGGNKNLVFIFKNSLFQIFLTIIGITANGFENDELGANLIIGSGMFNNMVIVAICICCIPTGEIRKIQNLPVFLVTICFSLISYIWLLIILSISSPQKIEVWEAAVTLGFLPILCLFSFAAEKGAFDALCCSKKKEKV